MRSLIRKNDIIIIACLLILSTLFIFVRNYINNSDVAIANLYLDGKIIKSVNLNEIDEPFEYKSDTVPVITVTFEKGCAYYSTAECKDKICVHTGKLDKNGQIAVCLPSKTILKIESKKDNIDAITY